MERGFSRGVMWLRYIYATKASNLAICAFVLPDDKKAQNKTYRIEKSSKKTYRKVVGFLRVLRFLPTRKVDRVVWVIKK